MKNKSISLLVLLVLLLPSIPVVACQSSGEPTLTQKPPFNVPVLRVWEYYGRPMLEATFPDIPGCIVSLWTYEHDGDFLGSKELDGGKIELRHRSRKHPIIIYVTTVTPENGAVDLLMRMEVDEKMNEKGDKVLPELKVAIDYEKNPNYYDTERPHLLSPCIQLGWATNFNAAKEKGGYSGYIDRCFLFTEKGMVIPPEEDKHKSPSYMRGDPLRAWVQSYAPINETGPDVLEGRHWNYGKTRYVVPIIGTLSHDKKYLVAAACEHSTRMIQAWHTCLHNDPVWLPEDAKAADQRWHMKIYAMDNDPAKLLKRYKEDFPGFKGKLPKCSK